MVMEAGGKKSLWKRSIRVLCCQTIFGEECAFRCIQPQTKKEYSFKIKAGGQAINL